MAQFKIAFTPDGKIRRASKTIEAKRYTHPTQNEMHDFISFYDDNGTVIYEVTRYNIHSIEVVHPEP